LDCKDKRYIFYKKNLFINLILFFPN